MNINSSFRQDIRNKFRQLYNIPATVINDVFLDSLIDKVLGLIKVLTGYDFSEKTYNITVSKGDRLKTTQNVFYISFDPVSKIKKIDNYYDVIEDGSLTITVNTQEAPQHLSSVIAYLVYFGYKNSIEKLQGVESITQNTGVVSETTAFDLEITTHIQKLFKHLFFKNHIIWLKVDGGMEWL